jgi:hypothetical protein
MNTEKTSPRIPWKPILIIFGLLFIFIIGVGSGILINSRISSRSNEIVPTPIISLITPTSNKTQTVDAMYQEAYRFGTQTAVCALPSTDSPTKIVNDLGATGTLSQELVSENTAQTTTPNSLTQPNNQSTPTPNGSLPVTASNLTTENLASLWNNPNSDLYSLIRSINGVQEVLIFSQTSESTQLRLVTVAKETEAQVEASYNIITVLAGWILEMGNAIENKPIGLSVVDSEEDMLGCQSVTSYSDLLRIAQGGMSREEWQLLSNVLCG